MLETNPLAMAIDAAALAQARVSNPEHGAPQHHAARPTPASVTT
jgi:hypothetical protein